MADLDEIVQKWFVIAEVHLLGELHVDPAEARRYCGRGGRTSFKLVRPEVKRMHGRAKSSSTARAWFWLADRLGELAKLPVETSGGGWEHRQALLRKILAWAPPIGEVVFRALWRERLRGVVDSGGGLLRLWQGLATGVAEAENATFISERRRQTRQWVMEVCSGATGGAHKMSKLPAGWRPDPSGRGVDGGGPRPLGRQERVDALATLWRTEIWGPRADKVACRSISTACTMRSCPGRLLQRCGRPPFAFRSALGLVLTGGTPDILP